MLDWHGRIHLRLHLAQRSADDGEVREPAGGDLFRPRRGIAEAVAQDVPRGVPVRQQIERGREDPEAGTGKRTVGRSPGEGRSARFRVA